MLLLIEKRMELELISIFVLFVWHCLASNKTSNISSEKRLLRLYPTSFAECVEACFNNADCERFVYEQLGNLCDLHNALEQLDIQDRPGRQLVTRSEMMKMDLMQLGAMNSRHEHNNACSLSDFEGHRTLGNMNRAGDRIIVDYGANASKCMVATFLCNDNGKWIQTTCNELTALQRRMENSVLIKDKPRTCDDIVEGGILWSGIYTIFPNGQDAVEVFCDFEYPDGPWTVLQRRVDDTVNFYRNYTEYQDGFGDLKGNFWLGLDTISTITQQSGKTYSLKVVILDQVAGERFAKYSWFHVSNVSTNYILGVGGYNGNAGDSLSIGSNYAFSTYDMDMDGTSFVNCAARYTGAWWYHRCHRSNLNGRYGVTQYGKGINWYSTTGFYRSALFATMKLKQRVIH